MANRVDKSSDKSYLYNMQKVKTHHRGFPRGTRDLWKKQLDQLEAHIQQECNEKLTDLSLILSNTYEYDVTARALGMPTTISSKRPQYSDSSDETLVGLPTEREYVEGLKANKKSFKSMEFNQESLMLETSSSLSAVSSSFVDFSKSQSRWDTYDRALDDFEQLEMRPSSLYQGDDSDDDLYVNPPTPPPEEDMEPWVDKRSPYQKFFSLAEYKATRWRRGFSESKPTELLTVQEREELLYNKIASDFCKWVAECQFQKVQLDETTIAELFQVGMETPALKAMCVMAEELPVVPAQVASIFNMPEKSEMAGVRRQVKWDKTFVKLEKKGIVNKPRWRTNQYVNINEPDSRENEKAAKSRAPRSDDTLDKWFSTSLLDKREKSGEMLWAELEKTKVFKHFCNWMIDNEKFKKPKYLEKKGYFKSKYPIDETEMVRVVRRENDSAPLVATVGSTRHNLENLIIEDKGYAAILEELYEDIPALKTFIGFDVADKRAKALKHERKEREVGGLSPLKPLAEGLNDDAKENVVHYLALLNHPEWP